MNMAPWEELQYFRLPVQVNVTAGLNPSTLIAADLYRVFLSISLVSAGTGFVSINPAPASNQGISVTQTVPIWLTARDHPTLVQAAWFIPGGTSLVYSVISVAMFKWPEDPAKVKAFQEGSTAYAQYLGRVQGQKARVERAADIMRRIREGRV